LRQSFGSHDRVAEPKSWYDFEGKLVQEFTSLGLNKAGHSARPAAFSANGYHVDWRCLIWR
jgi:hypothetical protein